MPLTHSFVLLILIFPFSVHGQQLNVESRIDSLVQEFNLGKNSFNGNILVSKQGKIVYEKSFGCADCKGNILNTAQTEFYIASVSKSFTSTAILQLVEGEKISLDQTLDSFFTDLPDWSTTVTVKNLLNHTAGIPDYIRNGWVNQGMTNSQVYNKIKGINYLDFKPGLKLKYSNSGYVLLAYIIEYVTAKSYEEYLLEYIFNPCNMSNSWVHSISNTKMNHSSNRAIGYRLNTKKVDDYNLFTYGDGGIFSTSEDLLHFSNALTSNTVLSIESLQEMSTSTVLKNGTIKAYGLGWFLGRDTEGTYVYHTGQLAGFRTYYEVQLDSKNTIVILNNTSMNNLEKLRNGITKILREDF